MLRYGRANIYAFHASTCKNTVHYLAQDWATVVCNLDADRIITSELVKVIMLFSVDDPSATKYRVFQGRAKEEGSACGTVSVLNV